MKSTILASACAVVFATCLAQAADMPVKARSVPVSTDNWTGLYVGANAGYGWGRSKTDAVYYAPNAFFPGACLPVGGDICANNNDRVKLNGALGGVQAGLNEQRGSFVYGIETDFQFSGQKGNLIAAPIWLLPNFPDLSGSIPTQESQKLQWFGTLRGRAGVVVGSVFFYGTAGLAYGQASATGTAQITSPNVGQTTIVPFATWNTSSTKLGWTAGAGIESRISQNWSMKLEYLYFNLGSIDSTASTLPGCYGAVFICANISSGTASFHRSLSDNVIRVGLNYRP